MTNISIDGNEPFSQEADVGVVLCFQGEKPSRGWFGGADDDLRARVEEVMEQEKFTGKVGEWLTCPAFGLLPVKKIVLLGLGKKAECSSDVLRKVGGHLAKRGRGGKLRTVQVVASPGASVKIESDSWMQAFVEGVLLGGYRFHVYKKQEEEDHDPSHGEIEDVKVFLRGGKKEKILRASIVRAETIAESVMLARTLVNTPSAHMTPIDLVRVAEETAEGSDRIECTVLTKEKMEELGMEAALAVGRGSIHEPCGAHLVYHPKRKPVRRIALVGKAVTFDSGGLSIKPSDGMMTMKIDMAGAATVIGLFHALRSLNVPVEVHGIFLAAENMPSGSAYRPGDVVKAMNGTTIEVLNTDAEGRVTLADALVYAQTFKPDAIVDLATLTGACVVALGEDIAAVMSNDAALTKSLLGSAKDVGELLWELPLHSGYDELIKSKVADVKNIGGRPAGAITAGLFLRRFVKETPWAHIDLAGPSYAERETRPDIPFGGTGYGVRFLLRYLESIA